MSKNLNNQLPEEHLLEAVKTNNILLVQNLINEKVNINAISQKGPNQGYSALLLAAENNYLAIADLLIKNGADVNLQTPDNRFTNLSLVLKKERKEKEELEKKWKEEFEFELEEEKEEANIVHQKYYNLMLDTAIKRNQVEMAKLLLENGIPESNITKARTALDFALIFKHEGMVQLLIEKGAIFKASMLDTPLIQIVVTKIMDKILSEDKTLNKQVAQHIKYLCTYTDEGKILLKNFTDKFISERKLNIDADSISPMLEAKLKIKFNEGMYNKLVCKNFFGQITNNNNNNTELANVLDSIFGEYEFMDNAISSIKPSGSNNNDAMEEVASEIAKI